MMCEDLAERHQDPVTLQRTLRVVTFTGHVASVVCVPDAWWSGQHCRKQILRPVDMLLVSFLNVIINTNIVLFPNLLKIYNVYRVLH